MDVGLRDPTRCCPCPGVEQCLSQDREQSPHCSALGHSWWDNTQTWGKSHLPPLTGALQPHGNSPPACDYPSSSWRLFVPMPPTGDRLDSAVVWQGKNYPTSSHTGIGFVGIFILMKAQARTCVCSYPGWWVCPKVPLRLVQKNTVCEKYPGAHTDFMCPGKQAICFDQNLSFLIPNLSKERLRVQN